MYTPRGTMTDEQPIYDDTLVELIGRHCNRCGHEDTFYLTTVGQQDVARCRTDTYMEPPHYAGFNAPRRETGRTIRPLSTRPGISPSQRSRIMERDNFTCVFCHNSNTHLVIAHLISENEGRQAGLTDRQLYDDENLVASCDECNSGQSDRPISLRFAVALLRARLEHQQKKGTQHD